MPEVASPGHKLGQMIGNFFEELFADDLMAFCHKHGFYCDRRGLRPRVRGTSTKITLTDKYGNKHDLEQLVMALVLLLLLVLQRVYFLKLDERTKVHRYLLDNWFYKVLIGYLVQSNQRQRLLKLLLGTPQHMLYRICILNLQERV